MDDADTDFNDMLFFEKQAVQPSSAEKINGNEAYCDARADQTARSAVLLRQIRLFCAKAPADQCNRCGDNFQTLIGAINKAKPATLKGQYLKSVTLAPTMGPGVKVNTLKLA